MPTPETKLSYKEKIRRQIYGYVFPPNQTDTFYKENVSHHVSEATKAQVPEINSHQFLEEKRQQEAPRKYPETTRAQVPQVLECPSNRQNISYKEKIRQQIFGLAPRQPNSRQENSPKNKIYSGEYANVIHKVSEESIEEVTDSYCGQMSRTIKQQLPRETYKNYSADSMSTIIRSDKSEIKSKSSKVSTKQKPVQKKSQSSGKPDMWDSS